MFSVEGGKPDKGKVMPTKQNSVYVHIKMLENCFSKAENRKQILEIWQKLSEKDVLSAVFYEKLLCKTDFLKDKILRTAVAKSNIP